MRFWTLPATILLCILIFFTIFFTGCTSNRGIGSEIPQGEGFTDITPREDLDRISLSDALSAFENPDGSGVRGSLPLNIYYIRGESIDANASARGWAIGALKDGESLLYIYTPQGQYTMGYNGKLPSQQIDIEKVLTPEDLFKQRPRLIQDLTGGGTRDITALELREDSYIMTYLSEGKLRVFYFDAVTGVETRQE